MKIATFILGLVFLSGCAAYQKTGAWTPDSLNYSISRDRQTGELVDYFGASWSLKK